MAHLTSIEHHPEWAEGVQVAMKNNFEAGFLKASFVCVCVCGVAGGGGGGRQGFAQQAGEGSWAGRRNRWQWGIVRHRRRETFGAGCRAQGQLQQASGG